MIASQTDVQKNSHTTMTMKLVQKRFLTGTREFEIAEDAVNARIKPLFKEEKLTSVALKILNPEPVVNGSYLEFHSRVKCGPLLSLFLNMPNVEEFNAFVETLKQRALGEYNAFAGIKTSSQTAGLAANVYDEPPEFEELDQNRLRSKGKSVDAAQVDSAIRLLERYLVSEDVKPLLSALEALKDNPQDESCLLHVVNVFSDLGPHQGAVLTYAPYIGILMSDDPFEN